MLFVQTVKPSSGCHLIRSSQIVGLCVGLMVGVSVLHSSTYLHVGVPNMALQHSVKLSNKY